MKRTIVVVSILLLLVIAPALLILDRHGYFSSTDPRALAEVAVEYDCTTHPSIDASVVIESPPNIGIYFNHIDYRECDGLALVFTDLPTQVLSFNGADLTNDIRQRQSQYYELDLLPLARESLTMGLKIYSGDVVSHDGLSTFSLKASIRMIAVTNGPNPEPNVEYFVSIPIEYQLLNLTPTATRQKVVRGKDGVDHVKHIFTGKQETFIATWHDSLESSVLYMMLLSALFGIGISGLVEIVVSRLKAKE